jgi:5-methylcytosine-specific restriction endonuclease McrA
MKICPKCQQEHEKTGMFCSRSCANSRKWTEEDKENKRNAAKDYLNNLPEEELEKVKKRLSENAVKMNNNRLTKIDYILNTNFELLAWQSKRIRVILEQDCKCLMCGVSEWMGVIISLEVDHIDGDNKNNCRENLRGLCPNCHSLTDTWRGKKSSKSKRQKQIDDLHKVM